MDDMTTLLLIPLVVGILTVFVEYFVIVPLKGSASMGGITILSKAFAVLTVIAVSGIALVILAQSIPGIPSLSLPQVQFPSNGWLTDANYTFAAIVIICILSLTLTYRWTIFPYIVAIVPTSLVFLWLLAFARHLPFLVLIALFVCCFWIVVTFAASNRSGGTFFYLCLPTLTVILWGWLKGGEDIWFLVYSFVSWFAISIVIAFVPRLHIVASMLSHDIRRDVTAGYVKVLLVLAILWPVNSLILISAGGISAIWGWIMALILGVSQMFMLGIIYDRRD